MPIKNLTDTYRLPRVGKIHLGLPPTDGKNYPTSTDYFVCPPEVHEVYGDQPKGLDILFPVSELETFASTYYRSYSRSRGLLCKGDGELAERTVDMATLLGPEGVLPTEPPEQEAWPIAPNDSDPKGWRDLQIVCRGPECPVFQDKGCKRMMMLQFVLPKVSWNGIYQIDTTSLNGIRNVYGAVQMIQAVLQRPIGMIPLKLTLEPMKVTPRETGRTNTRYVLNLACDMTAEAMGKYAQLQAPDMDRKMLPDPEDDVPSHLVADEESADGNRATKPVAAPAGQEKPQPAAAKASGEGMIRESTKAYNEAHKPEPKPEPEEMGEGGWADEPTEGTELMATPAQWFALTKECGRNHITNEILHSTMLTMEIIPPNVGQTAEATYLQWQELMAWVESWADSEHTGEEEQGDDLTGPLSDEAKEVVAAAKAEVGEEPQAAEPGTSEEVATQMSAMEAARAHAEKAFGATFESDADFCATTLGCTWEDFIKMGGGYHTQKEKDGFNKRLARMKERSFAPSEDVRAGA